MIILIKTNREPTVTSSNIFFIYKKLLQTFPKSICLVNKFVLQNSVIRAFGGTLQQVSQQLHRKKTIAFGIFPSYCEFVAAT